MGMRLSTIDLAPSQLMAAGAWDVHLKKTDCCLTGEQGTKLRMQSGGFF